MEIDPTEHLDELATDYDWTGEQMLDMIKQWARANGYYVSLVNHLNQIGEEGE